MLDFYVYKDDDHVMEFPIEKDFIGSIAIKEFEKLDYLKECTRRKGIEFRYFEDFIIQGDDLKIISGQVSEFLSGEKEAIDNNTKVSYERMLSIFNKSIENNVGIICFGD